MKLAVGYVLVSMIRPLNCASRRLWSLATVVMSTVKLACVTVVPLTTMEPVTALVRPTAAWPWPKRTSLTRYPTIEPVAMFQVPSVATFGGFGFVVPEADEATEGVLRTRGTGAEPATKWM